MRHGARGLLVAAVAALAVAAGVTAAAVTREPQAPVERLVGFADCADFSAHMQDLARDEVTAYGLGVDTFSGDDPRSESLGGPISGPVAEEAAGGGAEAPGVVRPDVTDRDGDLVLTLAGGVLHIVDVSADKPRGRGRLAFPEGRRMSQVLALGGHRVLVFGDGRALKEPGPGRYGPGLPNVWGIDRLVLSLVDIRDPTHPRALRSEQLTGTFVAAALHEGSVRIALGGLPRFLLSEPSPHKPGAAELERNRATVRALPVSAWLPAREVLDSAGGIVSTAPLVSCPQVLRPAAASGLGMISVLTLDATPGARVLGAGEAVGVVGDGIVVHTTADRTYVATTDGGLSHAARSSKPRGRSGVHAFDAIGRYLRSTRVGGFVAGRGSLSAQDGYLRVATSTGLPWTLEGEDVAARRKSVLVLAARADELTPVGRVEGFAPHEQIGVLRWLGPLLAVTPNEPGGAIHLVDLSKPTHPRICQDLPAAGRSLFLHRLEGDRFLVVGPDGPNDKRDPADLAVSTYDLAASRTPLDSMAFGYGYTAAEYEPRAFSFLPDRGLALILGTLSRHVPAEEAEPVATRAGTTTVSGPGVLAVRVDPDGHLHAAGTYVAEHWIQRVFALHDRLVVVTSTAVVLLDPNGLRVLGSVKLAKPSYGDY